MLHCCVYCRQRPDDWLACFLHINTAPQTRFGLSSLWRFPSLRLYCVGGVGTIMAAGQLEVLMLVLPHQTRLQRRKNSDLHVQLKLAYSRINQPLQMLTSSFNIMLITFMYQLRVQTADRIAFMTNIVINIVSTKVQHHIR